MTTIAKTAKTHRTRVPATTLLAGQLPPRDAKLPKPLTGLHQTAWSTRDTLSAANQAVREASDAARGATDPKLLDALGAAEHEAATAETAAKVAQAEFNAAAVPHLDTLAEPAREQARDAEQKISAGLEQVIEGWAEMDAARGTLHQLERFTGHVSDSLGGLEPDPRPMRRALDKARDAIAKRARWRGRRPAVDISPAEAIAVLEHLLAQQVGEDGDGQKS